MAAQKKDFRRDAGRLGLLFSNLGGMIGSGWLFGALNAAKIAGPAAIIAWIIGGIAVTLLAFVYAELTTAFPRPGAIIAFPKLSHGALAAQVMSWVVFLAYVAVPPVEAVAVVTYANNYLPGLATPATGALTALGLAAALVLLALFLVINLFAIRLVLAINNVITVWKLIVPIIAVIALLGAKFHQGNFAAAGFAPYGADGVFSAVSGAGIIFTFLGFRQAIELAGESANPARTLPFAIIGSVGFCILLYVGLQIAFIGALAPADIAQGWKALHFPGIAGPFAGLAAEAGLAWLAIALYIDAFISPAGTGIIYNTAAARVIFATGKEGLMIGSKTGPLAQVSANGVPVASLLLGFVVGIFFLLPFPSWRELVKYLTSVGILTYGIGPVVFLTLRKTLPADTNPRPYRLAFGVPIAAVSFIISNFVVFWAGAKVANHLFGGLAALFALYLLNVLVRERTLRHLEWRGALWLLPYFAGLWAITAAAPASLTGGIGLLSSLAASIAMIVFSLAILALAAATGISDPVEARESLRVPS